MYVACLWQQGQAIREEWYGSVITALFRACAMTGEGELVTLEQVVNPYDDRVLICAFGEEESAQEGA
jgi:hypothetical protein